MAVFAGDLFVTASQMKIGVFVMFEFGAATSLHCVTFLALLAVLSFVLVSGFMAGETISF